MCLDIVTKRYFFARPKSGIAYKSFTPIYDNTMVRGTCLSQEYNLNQWYKSKSLWVIETGRYIPGFHCIVNLEDAKWWASAERGMVYKVEYSGVLAYGVQSQADCVISKWMRILEQVKTGE
jgi:hypothetical protein